MSDEEQMEKLNTAIRVKLLKIYEVNGYEKALQFANDYLNQSAKVGKEVGIKDFGKLLRGELSEIFLEICVRDYVKKHKKSFYIKSLCVPRTDGKEGFTEIDLTLFTANKVVLFECKSYSGNKTLIDEGLMCRENFQPYNVFKQSRMHLDNLRRYLNPARLCSADVGKPYVLCMFSFSKDPIKDLRVDEWKKKFILLTEENILDWLEQFSQTKVLWDINKLYNIVANLDVNSIENKKKHIQLSKL